MTAVRKPALTAPIFIVGAGRSGTTLLQSVLSGHSRIAIAPETHFGHLSEAYGEASLDEDPRDFEVYWRRYVGNRRFADLGVSPERCRELIACQGEKSYKATLTALLLAYGERTGKARIGEKSPSHRRYARQFLEWFPDARIIAIRRDPRAKIASELRVPWREQKSRHHKTLVGRATRLHIVRAQAASWAEMSDEELPVLARDPRVASVRYEDFVQAPEETTRALCDFLGEQFEPSMLDDRRTQAAPDPKAFGASWAEFRAQHHDAARRPIDVGAMEKWRTQLTSSEVAVIEAMAGDAMRRQGYENFDSSGGGRRRSNALAVIALALGNTELALRRLDGPLARRLRRSSSLAARCTPDD